MSSTRVFKLIAEFLGFLLVSTGGTLLAIAALVALSGVGPGAGDSVSSAWWLALVPGCGLCGVAMLAAGLWLVRRSK